MSSWKKPRYYPLYKTKIYIKLFLFIFGLLPVFTINSCANKRKIIGYTWLRISKVEANLGKGKFIFIPLKFQNDSLEYKAVANNLALKLNYLGYQETDNLKFADYAIVFITHDVNSSLSLNSAYNTLAELKNIKHVLASRVINQNFDFLIYVFKVKAGNIDNILLKASVKHLDIKNNLSADYQTLQDSACAVDALFSDSVNKAETLEEYNYKCLITQQ